MGSVAAEPEADGILLYYHFTPLGNERSEEERRWMEELCLRLGLVGRVRVARDGINCTLGGRMEALQEHAKQVARHFAAPDIDFKLSVSTGPKNDACRRQSGFTKLSIMTCKVRSIRNRRRHQALFISSNIAC